MWRLGQTTWPADRRDVHAAARVVMAYALPLDLVPLLSVLLLLLLIGVVQGGNAYGARHLSSVLRMEPTAEAGRPSGTPARDGPT